MRYLTYIVILLARFAYYLLSLDSATPANHIGRHRLGEVKPVFCTYHPDDLRGIHARVPDKELWRFRMLYIQSNTPSIFTVPYTDLLVPQMAIAGSELPPRGQGAVL